MANSGSFNTTGYDGRYLTFAWTVASQNIANNTTTISWTLKGAGTGGSSWYRSGNFKVVINGATVYSSTTRIQLYNGTLVASGNYTITHNSDGTKSFSASAEAGIYTVAVNCKGSGTFTLPAIPRQATISKATNFNDTGNPTITYSNPAGNNVTSLQACISLNGTSADIPYRNISKTGTSYTFNLTESERNTLRQACANSKTLNVRFYVQTVMAGTTYRNYVTATMTIVNANPTFSVAYLDTNSTTTAITNNNQQIIQNKSTLRINITNAKALKYATLVSASADINGNIVSGNFSSGSNSLTLNIGVLNVANNLKIPVTVLDSRNNKTVINLNVIVLSWSLPSALITLARLNNFYTETHLTVDANYSSLDSKNTITIQYQIKKTTDSSYGALTTIQDNVETTFNADNNYSWNVKVILTDRLGSFSYELLLYKGIPLIYFDKKLSSVGINCFPQQEYDLYINGISIMDTLFFKNNETLTIQGAVVSSGFLSSSTKQLRFSVVLPKSMANITNITAQTMKLNARISDGGYLFSSSYVSGGYDVLNDSTITVTVEKATDNILNITLDKTSVYNGTNNTPVAVAIETLTLKFTS